MGERRGGTEVRKGLIRRKLYKNEVEEWSERKECRDKERAMQKDTG